MPAIPLTRIKMMRKLSCFLKLITYINDDILDDIKFTSNSPQERGIEKGNYYRSNTIQNKGIPVVRAIVPGLETLEVGRLYTKSELLMGRRAKSHFRNIQYH